MKRAPSVKLALSIAVIGMLCVAPLFVDLAAQGILSKMLIAAVFATAFNLLAGQTGLLSFGQSAYFGLGAISVLHVMIWIEHGVVKLPTPLLPIAGALIGFVSAAFAGYFASKRSGTYFALVTLAMAELVYVIAPMWHSFFGGEEGLTSMRMPWLQFDFSSARQVYFLVLSWAIISIAALWAISRTAFGQLLLALKENEQRLTFLGFNTHWIKILAFSLSGAFSGLAGGLLALTNETANFSLFGADVSLQVVFHAFVGGTGIFLAPAIAAAVLTALSYSMSDLTQAWPLYQGLIFMVVMFYAPNGIGGAIEHYMRGTHSYDRASIVRGLIRVVAFGLIAMSVVAAIEGLNRLNDSNGIGRNTRLAIFQPFELMAPPYVIALLLSLFVGACVVSVLLLRWSRKLELHRDVVLELTGAE